MAEFADEFSYSEGRYITEDEGADGDPTFPIPASITERCVQPYQFEPMMSSAFEQPSDNVSVTVTSPIVAEESAVSDWCDCGKCARMPLPVNNFCCRRNRHFLTKIEANNEECPDHNANCYTEIEAVPYLLHPAFLRNTYIIWCAYSSAKQKQLPLADEVDVNRRNRFSAYRAVTTHIYDILGATMLTPLPACVETHIKNLFPDPTGQYVGFEEWMPDA